MVWGGLRLQCGRMWSESCLYECVSGTPVIDTEAGDMNPGAYICWDALQWGEEPVYHLE